MDAGTKTFHEILRAARQHADQSVEVMAVLLSMTTEAYEALETLKYPDEETLKRLCLMNEWNYYDTQRLIINEMISPQRPLPKKDAGGPVRKAEAPPSEKGRQWVPAAKTNTLGDRLREVRLVTGQSIDIIAMLLNIDTDAYQRLEAGDTPSDEVLRRISVIYNWNYQDLISVLRSQHAKNFQPARFGMPFLGSTANAAKLRKNMQELEAAFMRVPHADQELALGQLELVRDSLRRHAKTT